ncbi:MAG: ATP-binding cassette domain-containing protein [Candidatus Marinimicrobia bacterium]|nr:ATP-binding cassette domain-containing protein [Candidatus Neomarinimicrobiota bacterium]
MILETRNLSKSFGSRIAVDNLSLEIPEGSVFGFLGPNGSGKSTTIRMMTDLIRPDSGEVLIKGMSVQKYHQKALAGVGAFIERADFYKHLSAQTNLEMLARMDGKGFDNIPIVLKRVGLLDRANDKVKHYSQGMRQRLGIAQALLSKPKLLILDEPTNGLDPQGMKEVRDLVRELRSEGITIFISSHLLDEVQKICTHVSIIHLGKLIISGKMDDLLAESDLFTIEVRVHPLDEAKKLLDKQDWVRRCDEKQGSLFVNVTRDRLGDVTKLLVQNECRIEAVIPKTSLEDLFLSKTGMNEPQSHRGSEKNNG